LTATSGNISLNGTAQSQWYGVRIQGSNITATNGSISLTGNSTNGTGLQLNGTNVHAISGNININGTVNKLSHYDVGQAVVHLNNVILNASSGSVNINGSVNSTVGDAYARSEERRVGKEWGS